MCPYEDFILQSRDYIICIGELSYPTIKSFLNGNSQKIANKSKYI